MANALTYPVYSIDTASTTPLVDCHTKVRLKGVRWVGATTAGHTATVQDGKARIVWTSVANAANYVEADTPAVQDLNGLTVPTLGSGTLYLELG